jgi:dihydrofolate reductase
MDWFIHDPEVDKAAHSGRAADTALFGRVTYQMFARHWPKVAENPDASKEERATADELDEMTKIVFSKTLAELTWVNSKLVKGDLIKEVRKLKQGEGSEIIIFGSGTIVQQLADAGLIDEYLLLVTPVVLGSGKSMFTDVKRFSLKLVEARGFASGNVMLHYSMGV